MQTGSLAGAIERGQTLVHILRRHAATVVDGANAGGSIRIGYIVDADLTAVSRRRCDHRVDAIDGILQHFAEGHRRVLVEADGVVLHHVREVGAEAEGLGIRRQGGECRGGVTGVHDLSLYSDGLRCSMSAMAALALAGSFLQSAAIVELVSPSSKGLRTDLRAA